MALDHERNVLVRAFSFNFFARCFQRSLSNEDIKKIAVNDAKMISKLEKIRDSSDTADVI